MSPTEEFITLVNVMREAQKEFDLQPTRGNLAEKQKREMRVDTWIQKHIAEKVQLELWTRSTKTGETAGVYNVGDEIKDENASAT